MDEYCPECGEVVDSDDTFCYYCGERLPGATVTTEQTGRNGTGDRRCPDCGVSVDADDSFCYYCGERLQ
jgi:endogenous inhibitor of DNA gyrase (YacG/DUF329 family)